MKSESIYADICKGYFELSYGGRCYVKHLTPVEQNALQEFYNESIERGVSLGCKRESEIVDSLIREGKWSLAEERAIKSYDDNIAQLEKSKPKIKSLQQIDSIYDSIENYRSKKIDLLTKKYSLIYNSAEQYAETEFKNKQMVATLFRDLQFSIPVFSSQEEFDYSDGAEFRKLCADYFEKTYAIGSDALKLLCVSPFFVNLFSIAGQPFNFFQIPVYKLTHFQVSLLKYAETFCKVVQESPNIPDEYLEIPDKILMYFYYIRNGGLEEENKQQDSINKMRQAIMAGTVPK